MVLPFGAGFFLDGADETTAEAVTLIAPFGPYAIGLYYYPWRRGQFVNYPLMTDRNNAMQPDVGGFILYNAGNIRVQPYANTGICIGERNHSFSRTVLHSTL